MPDKLDQTDDRESQINDLRIASIRAQRRELQPRGSCYWCAEAFYPGDPRLFCDDECSADWHKDRNRGR